MFGVYNVAAKFLIMCADSPGLSWPDKGDVRIKNSPCGVFLARGDIQRVSIVHDYVVLFNKFTIE